MLTAQITSGLMFGGGQQVALQLAARIPMWTSEPSLLILLGSRRPSSFPPIEVPWMSVESYDGRYNHPISLASTARALRRMLIAEQVTVAHSHGWDADVITGLACRGTKIKHIVHQHILADWARSTRPVHAVRRLVTRLALGGRQTRWVAVSHAVKASLRPLRWLPESAVRVVWNGVDLQRFRPSAKSGGAGAAVIGFAGRLAPMKGIEYLFEALAIALGEGQRCTLRLAGEGSLRYELERRAKLLGIAESVVFEGGVSDMPSFYNALDVLVLPSISTEGLPLVVLEGMASGLPVLSTTVSGIPEAVVNGVTGCLTRPRDPEALAAALERLIASPGLRMDMGRAGRRRVEAEFSLEKNVAQIAAVHEEVFAAQLAGRPSKRSWRRVSVPQVER